MIKKRKSFKLIAFLTALLNVALLCGCSDSTYTQINSLEELINGSYVIGTPQLTYCEEQAPDIFVNAKEFRSYGDMNAAYLALQQGKIDALIQDATMARVEINNGVNGVKILDGTLCEGNNIVVGISQNDIVSKNIINGILDDIKDTIADMKRRWIDTANYEMPNIQLDSSKAKLKIATSGNVEPFSFYKNGEITGFDIELGRRIAAKLNLDVKFEIDSNYTSLIASTGTGKTDLLIANLYETEERRTEMDLSQPYLVTTACAVVRDYSTVQGFTSIEELQNKKIAYETTSTQFEGQIDKYFPSATKVNLNSQPDCLAALVHNRVDALITDLPNAKFLASTTPGVMVLPEYLDVDNYGFVFEKNSSLTNEFNEVIADFKTRHMLDELEDKWFSNLDNLNKELFKQSSPSSSYEKKLRFITTSNVPPMTYLNDKNEIIGYEVDLIKMICEELNYEAEFLAPVDNIGSIFASIETKKAEGGFNCLSITDERKLSMDMTEPTYEGAVAVLVKNNAYKNPGFFDSIKSSFNKTFVIEQRWKMILEGLLMTVVISVSSAVLGILFGFGLCMLRRGKNKVANGTVIGFTKLIQGTPIVVLLMIFYYIIFGSIDISATIVSIFAFGINFGVYSSEIMLSGFKTVDKGQEEAARAMGYSRTQSFMKISLPQAANKFIPVLRGEFISMVKLTSIAGYISVMELTRVGDIIRSKTMEAFFPLIVIALIYFALAELLTLSLTFIEKKIDSHNKPFKLKGVKKHG